LKDYYAILQIPPNSTEVEIRKAYLRLAMLYHPDVNKSEDAHEKFVEISDAYECLISHKKSVYSDIFKTETVVNQENERKRQEAKERAQQQAKKRYEEIKRQQEAFQKSGINDLGLIVTIFFRILVFPLILLLIIFPLLGAILWDWTSIFMYLFALPFAGFLSFYVYENYDNYLSPNKFYYNYKRIKSSFTESEFTLEKCYYCPTEMADSKPYQIDLLKLKSIKLNIDGFHQHNANYKNTTITVSVPRSLKAFKIHSLSILIKLLSILICLLFLPFSSFIWCFIFGLLTGFVISELVFYFSKTKSHVSYVISYGLIFRIFIWLFAIMQATYFTLQPFDIHANSYIFVWVTSILLFDCILIQLISVFFGNYTNKPIVNQIDAVNKLFEKSYIIYNEIPVVSVIYPIYKWIFG